MLQSTLKTGVPVYSVCQGLLLVAEYGEVYICQKPSDILLECGRASDLRIIPVQSDFYCQATQFNNSRTNRIVGDMFFRTLHFWCTSAYSLKS